MYRPKPPTRLALWVLAMTMVWLTSCASRQARVTPVWAAKMPAHGVVYQLPKTELRIHFIVSESQFAPGPLVAYASRYLGESYPSQPVTRYQIERVAMHAHGIPDTTQSYIIESVAMPSVEQLISLTPDGLLYSLHGRAYQPTTTDYLVDYPKGGTTQATSQALPQEYALATSQAKQAEVAADRLFELRERRVELLSGQVETMPCDGPALKMVLEGLDQEVAALQALFAGHTTTRYYEEVVDVPITEAVSQQVVARFAPQYGVVSKEDLSGDPIYISITELSRPAAATERELQQLDKSHALRYIEPGRARATLQLPGSQQRPTLELAVAQWGRIALLDKKLGADKKGQLPYSIYFDPTSGALELIELPQQ